MNMMKKRAKFLYILKAIGEEYNHHAVIPIVLAIALFMESLDTTIITTAIPGMSMALNTSVISLKTCLTSYLIGLFFFIPISGWLADRFGDKKIFSLALIVFTMGSLFCGISSSLYQLIGARILQGIGGSLMMPVGRLILFRSFEKHELVKVSNYITIPALMGPLLGPIIGGAIVSITSWRWIFFINLPFGFFAWFLTRKHLIQNQVPLQIKRVKLDLVGFLLIGSGLVGLAFSIQFYDFYHVVSPSINFLILLSLGLCCIYTMYYPFSKNPVCDFKLLKLRSFKVGFYGMLLNRFSTGGIILILTLYLQIGLNLGPLISGLAIVPFALAMIFIKFVAKPILQMLGFKQYLFISHCFLGVSICIFSLITAKTSYCFIVLMVFIYGLFNSLNFSALSLIGFVDLDKKNMSKGTSLIGTVQKVSTCFGIIASTLILEWFSGSKNTLPGVSTLIFQNTFIVLGTVTFLSSFIFVFLKNYDGAAVSGAAT